jgi:hypothetical protein
MNEASIKRFWQPEYLLPFKITDRTSGENFKNWLRKQWFAPSKLKKSLVNYDALKGVYLPFWTYDADTDTDYTGERGNNRQEKYRNQKGEMATRTVTDWYSVSGNVHVVFDDVVVPASNTLPKVIAKQLTNWDMKNCVAFRKEFLAGFITEIYQRDFRVAIDDAKKKMETAIEIRIRYDIGGDEQRIKSKNIEYRDVKFKHLLLPVWISAFKFNGKIYQFVVNGRNGQVTGQYPKSIFKVALVVLAIIAAIAGIWWLLSEHGEVLNEGYNVLKVLTQ